MKKAAKALLSMVIITSMAIGSTSCSLFDKAGKLCKEVGDEFVQAALEKEIDDMADLCVDDDATLSALSKYARENECVDAILERATFTAGKPDCSTKDGKGQIEYTITLPDYEAALDEEPDDEDEFADLLDEVKGTIEIKVTLKFKMKKEDKWLIKNPEALIEDLYEELYNVNYGFTSIYSSWIDHTNFYNSNSGTYTNAYYLDYDVSPIDEYYSEDWSYSFRVYRGGDLVYDSGNRTDRGLIENYCYLSDTDFYSNYDYFPAGSYTFVLIDSTGAEIISETCTVVNTYD